MEFETWLEECGIDASTLSETRRHALQAAWRAEQNGAGAPTATADPPRAEPPPSGFDETVKAIEAETERVNYIQSVSLRAMEQYGRAGDRAKVAQRLTDWM